jgi:hypothetical protein
MNERYEVLEPVLDERMRLAGLGRGDWPTARGSCGRRIGISETTGGWSPSRSWEFRSEFCAVSAALRQAARYKLDLEKRPDGFELHFECIGHLEYTLLQAEYGLAVVEAQHRMTAIGRHS